MFRCYAPEMDKAKDLVQVATKANHNPASNGIDLDASQHCPSSVTVSESKPSVHISSNQRRTDEVSVQNNASSEATNEQKETNKSQYHRQNVKKGSAAEVDPKTKKAKPRLRKGKWTVSQ